MRNAHGHRSTRQNAAAATFNKRLLLQRRRSQRRRLFTCHGTGRRLQASRVCPQRAVRHCATAAAADAAAAAAPIDADATRGSRETVALWRADVQLINSHDARSNCSPREKQKFVYCGVPSVNVTAIACFRNTVHFVRLFIKSKSTSQ